MTPGQYRRNRPYLELMGPQRVEDLFPDFEKRIALTIENVRPSITFGIGRPTGGGLEFSYMACIEVDSNIGRIPEGMIVQHVSGWKYAKFTHRGSDHKIADLASYIYGIWLPKSGRTVHFGCEVEKYDVLRRPADREEEWEMELWVPIKSH